MRLLAPSLRASLALVVAVASSACDPAHDDAGRDGGPLAADASCEPLRCRPGGYRCRDGAIVALDTVEVSPCESVSLACPEGDVVRTCARGCVEGETADHPDRLCHETRLKQPGDDCAAPEECEPSGGAPLSCDLANGVCVLVGSERCNGLDDDVDGTVDERCACQARWLATLPAAGPGVDVAFGRGRIALLSRGRSVESTVRVVDPEGALLSVHEGLRHARRVVWEQDALVVVLHEGTTGSSTLVRIDEDGTETRTDLERTAPGEHPWLLRDGESWLLLTPVRSTSLGMTRHAPDGTRIAWAQVSGVTDVVFVASHGDERYLGLVGSPELALLDSALELVPASVPGAVHAPFHATSTGESLVFLTHTHEGLPGIVVRDATGAVSGPHELRDADRFGRGARIAVETRGERVGVAWRSSNRVRVHVAAGDALERVGEVAVSSPYDAVFALGDAGSGLRLVIEGAAGWELHDPCPPSPE